MTLQGKAFSFSVALHTAALCAILMTGMLAGQKRVVLLDFSLGEITTSRPYQAVAASVKRHKPAVAGHKSVAPAALKHRTVTPTENNDRAVPLPRQAETQEVQKPASAESADVEPSSGDEGTGSSIQTEASDSAREGYLAANFAGIRDKILKRLIYPTVARKMGWTGKVMVAFTVLPDGSVEDMSIVKSSGFSILDGNVVDAIKKSCPLPKPPAKTAMLMPIVYRLE